jgi:hypothetical protein
MIRLGLPVALAVALAGCGTSSAPPAPSADVAALEAGLTAAEAIATAYVRLPACVAVAGVGTGAAAGKVTNGPLCSDVGIVGQIKTADAQAYTAVKAAEAAGDVASFTSAQSAVATLTTITGALPVTAKGA